MQEPPATPPVAQSPPVAAAPLRQEELVARAPVRQTGGAVGGAATFPAEQLPLEAMLPLVQPDWATDPLRQVCPVGEPPVRQIADNGAASALFGPKPKREGGTYGFFFVSSGIT